MDTQVLLLGLLVGLANYLFRYLPLCLRANSTRPAKRGATGVLLYSNLRAAGGVERAGDHAGCSTPAPYARPASPCSVLAFTKHAALLFLRCSVLWVMD